MIGRFTFAVLFFPALFLAPLVVVFGFFRWVLRGEGMPDSLILHEWLAEKLKVSQR